MPSFKVFSKDEYRKASSIPRNLLAPKSREYAISTLGHLEDVLNSVRHSEEEWRMETEAAKREGIHKLLGFEALDELLNTELGVTVEKGSERKRLTVAERAASAKKISERQIGVLKAGPGRGKKTGNNITRFQRGTNADYLTAVIARDRPDILKRMKNGEYKSVRAAAIEAGIVKVPTALDTAQKAFSKLTTKEKKQFLKWAANQ